MRLQLLLHKLKENKINYSLISNPAYNLADIEITGASLTSKFIKQNWAFLALKGEKSIGNLYVKEAIQNGASVVFTDSSFPPDNLDNSPPIFLIPNLKYHLKTIASLIYDVDEKDFYFIGITGTNGKTTTTYIIEHVLNSCNHICAKLSTVEYRVSDYIETSILTTPDILNIYRILALAKEKKAKYVVMEMSSHGLVQERLNISNFKHSILTNIGHDHLDYHKTFEEYLNAKLKLFKFMDQAGRSVINVDDENSNKFINASVAKVITYGKNINADACIFNEHLSLDGSSFDLIFRNSHYHLNTKLIGLYNIYNTVAAFVCCNDLVKDTPGIIKAISECKNPPGRLEKVENRKYHVYIDYAHTPQALYNVLATLKNLKNKNSKLICIFGCGGNRDKEKRPIMGKIASELSDIVIITSDNPRSENPEDIIKDIKEGITMNEKVFEELDRKKAIKKAIELAKQEDVIIIAGKGHEIYQIFKEKVVRFSDKEVVLEYLDS